MAATALAALAPAVALGQEQVLTKEYDNGGVYEGTFVDGRQQGHGTYRLPNGYEYTGDWVEGRIEGEGRATFPDGSVYEGSFLAGQPEGKGRITYPDGGSYEGDWKAGPDRGRGGRHLCRRHALRGRLRRRQAGRPGDADRAGRARSMPAAGATASRQGQGKITYPNGATYEGEMADGAAGGQGQAHDGRRHHATRAAGRPASSRARACWCRPTATATRAPSSPGVARGSGGRLPPRATSMRAGSSPTSAAAPGR